MKLLKLFILLFLLSGTSFAQPWNNPLKIAWSTNGITFSSPAIFQDSAGVPSIIRVSGDTLLCGFQWFRGPGSGPQFDVIATKHSYDAGLTWTEPSVVTFGSLPSGFIRPFDPALILLNNGDIRMYFSDKPGPSTTLDSLVDTYSAISSDGINFTFDNASARFDNASKQVIDPTVIDFLGSTHFSAPVGIPSDGAYHATSSDGLTFSLQTNYTSDMTHNWTGNYCLVDSATLRFYGAGSPNIWYKESSDAINWSSTYTNTNITGGDNSVFRVSTNQYLLVYVGQPYGTTDIQKSELEKNISVYPNPAEDMFTVSLTTGNIQLEIMDVTGRNVLEKRNLNIGNSFIDISQFYSGIYFMKFSSEKESVVKRLVIK